MKSPTKPKRTFWLRRRPKYHYLGWLESFQDVVLPFLPRSEYLKVGDEVYELEVVKEYRAVSAVLEEVKHGPN